MKVNWVQAITNVSVIVGLVLILYELRQSHDLARSQLIDNSYVQAITNNLATMGESPSEALTRSFVCPEKLTANDVVNLHFYYLALLIDWNRSREPNGMGYFMDQDDPFATARMRVPMQIYLLNSEPGRSWWGNISRSQNEELVSIVDAALKQAPVEDNSSLFSEMLSASGSAPEHAIDQSCGGQHTDDSADA